jgi:hypothetical protein
MDDERTALFHSERDSFAAAYDREFRLRIKAEQDAQTARWAFDGFKSPLQEIKNEVTAIRKQLAEFSDHALHEQVGRLSLMCSDTLRKVELIEARLQKPALKRKRR